MSHDELPSEEDSLIDVISEEVTSDNPSLPTCEKCDSLINSNDSLVCRKCGWYASIGSFVEIDQSWEASSDPDADQILASEESESFRMPEWAWVMIGCVTVVIAESIAARYLTEAGSIARTRWSLVQLLIGGIAAAICHFVAFILLIRDDSEVALLDVLLRPLRPWALRVHELPDRQWICHTAISGIVAVLMSVLVIGGIPYERLWDWGFGKPVNQDLMGAIAEQAQKGNGKDQSLEEAVEELGGSQNLSDDEGKNKKAAKKPTERKEDDCVIIGYRANEAGIVYLLVLAGENFGHLQHVGQVVPQLPIRELKALGDQLSTYKTFDPFVRLQMDNVIWVEPKIACRVSYARKGKKGGLFDTKLVAILGEIDIATGDDAPAEEILMTNDR
ncbi:hypothetical protein [Bythopirellula polymerisocia]|uniref:DNA ligase (ATP) n=1 Tax=Bythopirellula polymerisocia TaxID=2528003 RepID=A0A5C6CKX3_9BACT|nr:hypothetical protein [Bythopirellula polymerisocia]TWU23776.1 hypothetical protein Pla144_39510 [Bythopirellula polymerisocia]